MSKKTVKKATKKSAVKPTIFVTVRKIPPVVSDLQEKRKEVEGRLQAIIDRNMPGAQLSAELNAEIHCHDCKNQVAVDDLFCPWCGIALIGKCKTCGTEKARKDPCQICTKVS